MKKSEVEEMVETAITYSDYTHLITILFTNYTEKEIHEILKSYIRQNDENEYDFIIVSITECLFLKQYIDMVVREEREFRTK